MRYAFIAAIVTLWAACGLAGDDTATIGVKARPAVVPAGEEPKPVVAGGIELPRQVGEPVKWVADNWTRWDGWCLSGYAWGSVQVEKYRSRVIEWSRSLDGSDVVVERTGPVKYQACRRWVKVGAVSGDLDAFKKASYDEKRGWAEFAEWERELSRRPALGVVVVFEF